MARLTEHEKQELWRVAEHQQPRPPKVEIQPPAVYVQFATFASRLSPIQKPVRFDGQHWKL